MTQRGHSPFDFSDGTVNELIRSAKKRGYVTLAQISCVLPSRGVSSEQLKSIVSSFGKMGLDVVDIDKAERESVDQEESEAATEGENEQVQAQQQPVSAKSEAKEPAERTDDPVRMYLREMSSVQLLSREGEIAIAKRMEAGRETMIAGLCESPLTFQAIIIWRDELNEGKVLLRDIPSMRHTPALVRRPCRSLTPTTRRSSASPPRADLGRRLQSSRRPLRLCSLPRSSRPANAATAGR